MASHSKLIHAPIYGHSGEINELLLGSVRASKDIGLDIDRRRFSNFTKRGNIYSSKLSID